MSNALEKYTKAVEARNAHIEKNKSIFDAHEKLVFAIVDAENELRDEVAVSKEGVSNDTFRVVVTPVKQKVYDEDKLKQFLTPDEFAKAVTEQERPVRISIQPVK